MSMNRYALIRLLLPGDDISSNRDAPAFSDEFIDWLKTYDPSARFVSTHITTHSEIDVLMLDLIVDEYSWGDPERDTFVFTSKEALMLFKLTWC